MKVYRYIHTFLLALALLACSPKDEVVDVNYVGIDKISRIELSPNGPLLVRDGKSALSFAVRCFYYADEAKSKEVLYLADRLPLDKITITSSEGRNFSALESYSTSSSLSEVSFKAKINGVTSPEVTVPLVDADNEEYPMLRIPLTFFVVYAPRDMVYTDKLDRATLQAMVDRANKVFAGELYKAPSTGNARMQFYIKDIKPTAITTEDSHHTRIAKYVNDNLLQGSDKSVHIWLLNTSVHNGLQTSSMRPYYTSADPNNIPGLKLRQVKSVDTNKNKVVDMRDRTIDLDATDVGITMSFTDVYRNATGSAEFRFEGLLGQYYGLLRTGYNGDVKDYNGDADYCNDTYTYNVRFGETLKKVMTKDADATPIFYKSYNIMDKGSASLALSQEQVKRIRRVILECPYRGQGH